MYKYIPKTNQIAKAKYDILTRNKQPERTENKRHNWHGETTIWALG